MSLSEATVTQGRNKSLTSVERLLAVLSASFLYKQHPLTSTRVSWLTLAVHLGPLRRDTTAWVVKGAGFVARLALTTCRRLARVVFGRRESTRHHHTSNGHQITRYIVH